MSNSRSNVADKVLSVLLAFIMLLSIVPVNVFASTTSKIGEQVENSVVSKPEKFEATPTTPTKPTYTITVSYDLEEGAGIDSNDVEVVLESLVVEEGEQPQIKSFRIPTGCSINTITVDGVAQSIDMSEQTINASITKDTTIVFFVTKDDPESFANLVNINETPIRTDNNIVVFGKDVSSIILTAKNGKISYKRDTDRTAKRYADSATISLLDNKAPIPVVFETIKTRTGSIGNYTTKTVSNPPTCISDRTAPEIIGIDDKIDLLSASKEYSFSVSDPNCKNSDNSEIEGAYSGIAKVSYELSYIENDVKIEVGSGELLNKTSNFQQTENIQLSIADTVLNKDLTLVIKVVDAAGNEAKLEKALFISKDEPVVNVSASGEQSKYANTNSSIPAYNQSRTFTVIVSGNADKLFSEENLKDAIKVTKDNEEFIPNFISIPNGVQFTLDKEAQGEYNIEIENYKNGATPAVSANGYEIANDSKGNEFNFIIDNKAPEKIEIHAVNRIWYELLNTLTFGLWSKDKIEVEATAEDGTVVGYYKDTNPAAHVDYDTLKAKYDNNEFSEEKIVVSSNEVFVAYACVIDDAGNIAFVSTDGLVYDDQPIEVDVNVKSEVFNNICVPNADGNVVLNVTAKENYPVYSGIKRVYYTIYKDYVNEENKGELIVNDTDLYLYNYNQSSAKCYDLEKEITIDAKKASSDSAKVIITAIDNAGNISTREIILNINDLSPTIDVKYDQTQNENAKENYYTSRTATITIKNDKVSAFNEDSCKLILNREAENDEFGIFVTARKATNDTTSTDADKIITLNDEDVVLSGWTKDKDSNTVTATLTFKADAEYEWTFKYKAKTNKNAEFDKDIFISDSIAPTGTVTVDKNIWDTILETITFGIYKNNDYTISATVSDNVSPATMEYYICGKFEADRLGESELLEKAKSGEFKSFDENGEVIYKSEDAFVVFVKFTDAAGNTSYICSDGHVLDKTASKITVTPEEANKGFYNGDVNVNIFVEEDTETYSGIKEIKYSVLCNNKESQNGTLYSFKSEKSPGKNELKKNWDGSIVVEAKNNNSNDVKIIVTTVDNAGNESSAEYSIKIDTTVPTIDIKYDQTQNENAKENYYTSRTATITITERNFDAARATNGVSITAVNVNGKIVENAYTISDWVEEKGSSENGDDTKYTATVEFSEDANYTFKLNYTDKANNSAEECKTVPFTVDSTVPTDTITATFNYNNENIKSKSKSWSDYRSTIIYDNWANESISFTQQASDATSPIDAIKYYIEIDTKNATGENDVLASVTTLSLDELKEIPEENWNDFGDGFTVTEDQQFVVYLKVVDYAGNVAYFNTDGLTVDHQHPAEEIVAPEITVNPQQPINDIYNGNVNVDVRVVDPKDSNGTYSGLKEVKYEVYNYAVSETVPTQTDTLYNFTFEGDLTPDKLVRIYKSAKNPIVVDCTKNNSNNVVVRVIATDNAGNTSYRDVSVKIDTTAPVIDIKYDNNSADKGTFFKANRTATLVVTERNFNPDDVKITIKNTDGVIPKLSEWTKKNGSDANRDNTTYTAKVKYSADGDYTFAIEYTDQAGNKCKSVNYANGTVAGDKFTIDRTNPTINVSYNNNNAKNGKYFAQNRTATVVIREHNFDVNRVKFTIVSKLNGVNIGGPSISWVNNGDVHTATIAYTADGDYTFDVTLKDKAGNDNSTVNYGSTVAGKDFTIDKKIDKPIISGVENGKAYKDEVIPSVSFSDVNYASNEIRLFRTRMGEKNVDVTSKYITGVGVNGHSGSGTFNTFKREQATDGIYTLSVKVVDKAGNEASQSVIFTVNRFGSVYEYSDYLVSLIRDGGQYIKAVDEKSNIAITKDLIITEYNADRLVEGSLKILITRDGEPINAKYTTNPATINANTSIGESGWFQYVYSISKDNFIEDGVYKITISSKDATENTSISVPKNSIDEKGEAIVDTMTFTVDKTKPEIRNIVNLDNAVANKDSIVDGKLHVQFTLVDIGGLAKVEIFVNGILLDTIKKFDSVNNYVGSFDLNESSEKQTVRIVVTDLAGNITDTASKEFDPGDLFVFNDTVTVSTNAFVRWYSNTPLFVGSIAGVSAVVVASWRIIALKKRKKNK